MTCRERLERYLRAHNAPFTLSEHLPAFTAQAAADQQHLPGGQMAKVVLVTVDGELAMLVLPAARRVDLACVRELLRAQEVRLADEAELAAAFPDCEVGAMPPFGNLYHLPVYSDLSLALSPRLSFAAGSHRETMQIAYADFARLVPHTTISFATRRQRRRTPLPDVHEMGAW